MRKYLISILLIMLAIQNSMGQLIELDQREEFTLKGNVRVLFIRENKSPTEVLNLFKSSKYSILERQYIIEKPKDRYCWLFFKVKNDKFPKIVYFLTQRADIHYFDAYKISNGKIECLNNSGDGRPFKNRQIKTAALCFKFELVPEAESEILIKIDKRGESINTNLFLLNEEAFNKKVQKEYYFFFFFSGFVFLLTSFTFILYTFSKEKNYLYYLGIIFFNYLFVLTNSGMGFQYFWPNLLLKNSLLLTASTFGYLSFLIKFQFSFFKINSSSWAVKTTRNLSNFFLFVLIPIFFIPLGSPSINNSVELVLDILRIGFLLISFIFIVKILLKNVKANNLFGKFYIFSIILLLVVGALMLTSLPYKMGIRPFYILSGVYLFELFVIMIGLTSKYNNEVTRKKEIETRLIRVENEFSKKILKVQDIERQRIAQDLHDDLGGTLSVLKGIIGNGSIGFEADKVIDKAIRDLRAISRNLLPPELASIGFNKAVVNLVAFMESASKISFTFVSFGEEFRFEENKELNIFRIVSELLNNVLKHSKATKATIQLIYHQSHLFISVEDNGIGIETDKNLWGIGLKNIYSRTELLNAKLVVDSNPKGSTFILEIPY